MSQRTRMLPDVRNTGAHLMTVTRNTPFEELPEWLTTEEFRAYWGLGRSTVYDLIRRNEVPHKKFGRIIRIPRAWIENCENGA